MGCSTLRSLGTLVSSGVLESPFHVFGVAEPDSHRLIDRILLFHPHIQDEVWDQRPPHPAAATTMEQDGAVAGAAQHREYLVESGIIESAGTHWNVHILHAELSNDSTFVQWAWLHGIPNVQDDATAGRSEGL